MLPDPSKIRKTLVALFCCVIGTLAVSAETVAERAAALIASADTVKIPENDAHRQETVFQDPDWIQRVSKAVGVASMSHSLHCFSTGWQTFGFYKNDVLIISVAAIHGNKLRIYEPKGDHGDFEVDEIGWNAVNTALTSLHKPNKSLAPIPIPLTPVAGTSTLGAPHL